jgi:hypothetical protein
MTVFEFYHHMYVLNQAAGAAYMEVFKSWLTKTL